MKQATRLPPRIIAALWTFLGLWMILYNFRPIQDLDLWWHLASGRYIWTHFSIPQVDVFSLTAQGTSWINSYWLFDVMSYGVFKLGGLNGIIVCKSLFVTALLFLVARFTHVSKEG